MREDASRPVHSLSHEAACTGSFCIPSNLAAKKKFISQSDPICTHFVLIAYEHTALSVQLCSDGRPDGFRLVPY